MLSKCKTCSKKERKAYRTANLDKEKVTASNYYKRYLKNAKKNDLEVKKKWNKYLQSHRKKHPDRARARWAVSNAKRRGKMKSSACIICGLKESEAHHLDYSQPLIIQWLCHNCHIKLHRGSHSAIHEAQAHIRGDG